MHQLENFIYADVVKTSRAFFVKLFESTMINYIEHLQSVERNEMTGVYFSTPLNGPCLDSHYINVLIITSVGNKFQAHITMG